MIKRAQWAVILLGDGAPETRLRFALEAHSVERICLASEFVQHSTAIDWTCLKACCDPAALEFGIGPDAFIAWLDQLNRFGVRKLLQHPVAGVLLDFRSDTAFACAPASAAAAPGWADELTKVVVKAKLEASWWKDIPDSWDYSTADPSMITTLARIVGKVWPSKGPEWVINLRTKAQQEKENAKAAAAKALGSAAGAPDDINKEKPKEEEEEEKAEGGGTASAAAAPGSSAPAPPVASAAVAPELVVGDVVVCDDKVGQKFQHQEAQVLSVTAKMAKVKFFKMKDEIKQFPKTNLKIVQPSTLRKTMESETSAAEAPDATPLAASASAASDSAAEAPEAPSASAAAAPGATPIDEDKYTESVFGNVD